MKRNKLKAVCLLLSLLLTACSDENAEQCKTLINDEAMRALSISFCEKAANDGDAESQFNFATLLLAEGNKERAIAFLEKSANQKNGQAAYKLGEIYESQSNLEKATFYYEEGCKQSELKACERSRALMKQQNEKDKADKVALEKAKLEAQAKVQAKQIALEEAKARTLAQEKAKLDAEANAQEQARLNEEAKQRKAEIDAIKARAKGKKFRYGLAKYQDGALWEHINQDGQFIIKPQWAYAADFYDGLAAVKTTDGKWGYINTNGQYQIYPKFSCVWYFSEGLAAVSETGYGNNCQGGKWGFIDKNGAWVISPTLDDVIWGVFKNGVTKITYNGHTGYINRQAQWVNYQE